MKSTPDKIRSVIRRSRRRCVNTLERIASTAKLFAWRITASWIWLSLFIRVLGGRGLVQFVDEGFTSLFTRLAKALGFSPVNDALVPTLLKILWLVCITSFQWVQVIGLCLYLAFWPLVILLLWRYGKTIRDTKAKMLASKTYRATIPTNRPLVTYLLVVILLSWITLFGSSSQRNPLLGAILLCGGLLLARIFDAFTYTNLEPSNDVTYFDRYTAAALYRLEQIGQVILDKKMFDWKQLPASIKALKRYRWWLRFFSRLHYGKAARNRVSVVIFSEYLFHLSTVGCLAILFWAFVIRYSILPQASLLNTSILASASRIIPGTPEPGDLVYSDWIKASISLTAWLIFVVYIGPAASLFPALQDRAINQIASQRARLRHVRQRLNNVIRSGETLLGIVREKPEVEKVIDFLTFFKLQPDLNQLFKNEPELARLLASRPELIKALSDIGVSLPDLSLYSLSQSEASPVTSICDSAGQPVTQPRGTVQ